MSEPAVAPKPSMKDRGTVPPPRMSSVSPGRSASRAASALPPSAEESSDRPKERPILSTAVPIVAQMPLAPVKAMIAPVTGSACASSVMAVIEPRPRTVDSAKIRK